MILKNIEQVVGRFSSGSTLRPLYNGYSLVNVPNTVIKILNKNSDAPGPILDNAIMKNIETSSIKKVIMILIDGLGYEMFLDSYRNSEFFSRFVEDGMVTPLTSGFPSTTTASITTVNTGLTPQEHALPEWTLYFREIDKIIKPMPMVTIDEKREPLRKIIENPKILYGGDTIYQKMNNAGIASYAIQSSYIAGSTYNKLLNDGGTIIPYTTNSDMAIKVRKTVQAAKSGYIYGYLDSVDYTTHVYGPKTEESSSEITNIGSILQKDLIERTDRATAEETLVMITADHGHARVDPEKIIYLEEDKKLAGFYELGLSGKPICPSGFLRDVFFHIKENKLEEAKNYLLEKLGGKAMVLETKKAFEEGMFGIGVPNNKFFDRVGNLIAVPLQDYQIWHSKEWYDYIRGNKPHMFGMHGGLSKDEILIPLLTARMSDIM